MSEQVGELAVHEMECRKAFFYKQQYKTNLSTKTLSGATVEPV